MLHRGKCPDFAALAADGIRFAILAATAGRQEIAPDLFENLSSARRAGLDTAVYHDLQTGDLAGAAGEARHFLHVLHRLDSPPRWAICRVESPALPRDRDGLSRAVQLFLTGIRQGGYSPMLSTTEDVLRDRLSAVGPHELCRARWSVPEARALARNPRIWEYGEGAVGDLPRAVLLKGYF